MCLVIPGKSGLHLRVLVVYLPTYRDNGLFLKSKRNAVNSEHQSINSQCTSIVHIAHLCYIPSNNNISSIAIFPYSAISSQLPSPHTPTLSFCSCSARKSPSHTVYLFSSRYYTIAPTNIASTVVLDTTVTAELFQTLLI